MGMDLDFAVVALDDYDEDGHAQATTDSPGEPDIDGNDTAGTQPAEKLLPLGLHARALDPERDEEGKSVGLGCSGMTFTHGSQRYLWNLHDPRDVSKVPKLRKGGRMLEGGAGDYRSYFLITGLDPAGVDEPGSIMISAPYKVDGGKGQLGLTFNVRKQGEEEIVLLHGEGQKIVMSAKGAKPITIMNAEGSAWIDVADDGVTIAGDLTVQGSVVLGDPSATGVATQLSMLPMFIAFQAFLASFQVVNALALTSGPSTAWLPGGPAVALTATMTALQAIMALPTTFSMKVKASS